MHHKLGLGFSHSQSFRKTLLLCLLTSGMSAVHVFIAQLAKAADSRPNIILCMGDDHGWEETGYNGHPHVVTPTLDAMAASGLRLDRFYAGHPTCSPTRGSVLTGRHPNRYGTLAPNYSIRPEEITLAHLLRESGYATGHFGKWHLGPVKADSPTNPGAMGFDYWLSHDNFFELNPPLSRNGAAPQVLMGESSEILVEEALGFVRKAKIESKPFFVVIWFGSPHEPYSGLERDLAIYDDLPEELAGTSVELTSNETGMPTRRPLRDVLRERYAEITAMDRAMGVLREGLEQESVRDDTLIWYCGDNGTPASGVLASPLRGQKAQMYEGGIRVPGIIEWPARVRAARVSQVNAVTSDMFPTICGLAGIPLPDRPLDGIDLTPVIDGRMARRPQPIFFWSFRFAEEAAKGREPYLTLDQQTGTTPLVKLMHGIATRNFVNYRHPQIEESDYMGPRVVLDNDYKLVIGEEAEGSQQLFDLSQDPGERHNLLETHAEIAVGLEVQLRAWQTSVLNSLTGADY
ncbi:MAG: sulfatase-like hydrolase/transferase [bacterium]|nr:sulfatase-like hydrolase/transferase [bacterium]